MEVHSLSNALTFVAEAACRETKRGKRWHRLRVVMSCSNISAGISTAGPAAGSGKKSATGQTIARTVPADSRIPRRLSHPRPFRNTWITRGLSAGSSSATSITAGRDTEPQHRFPSRDNSFRTDTILGSVSLISGKLDLLPPGIRRRKQSPGRTTEKRRPWPFFASNPALNRSPPRSTVSSHGYFRRAFRALH